VSTGVRMMSKMMCLRNEVVPAEQRMCLRNDVPLARQRLTRPRSDTFDDSRIF